MAIQNLAPRLIRDLWRDTFYWWEDCKEARQRREEIRTKLIVNYERKGIDIIVISNNRKSSAVILGAIVMQEHPDSCCSLKR